MSARNLPSLQELKEFFDPKSQALNFLLKSEDVFPPANAQLWNKYFKQADFATPIQPNGSAIFSGGTITRLTPPMLLPRGTWSPPSEFTKGGFEFYFDALHDLGGMKVITAMDLMNYDKKAQQLGGSTVNGGSNVIDYFIQNLQDLVTGGNSVYTYLSMQLLSKGEWEYTSPHYGFKIHGICDRVRPEFKIKASTLLWSDPDAPILADLQRAVKLIRDKTGYEGVLTAKMSRTKFIDEVQTNNEIRNLLKGMLVTGGIIFDVNKIITIEYLNQWLSQQGGYYPLIELIEEHQVIQDIPTVKKDVNGWEKQMVIVSPAGQQGTIEWAYPEELIYLAKYSNRSVGQLQGGLFGVLNWERPESHVPSFETHVYTLGAPALAVYPYWVQIDTSQVEP